MDCIVYRVDQGTAHRLTGVTGGVCCWSLGILAPCGVCGGGNVFISAWLVAIGGGLT